MEQENIKNALSELTAQLQELKDSHQFRPLSGKRSKVQCVNIFLENLSGQYPNDVILLCCDGAAWHKTGRLQVPENIELFFIPPYTSLTADAVRSISARAWIMSCFN